MQTHAHTWCNLSVFVCLVFSAEREAEVLYEVLFDEEFAGGLHIR